MQNIGLKLQGWTDIHIAAKQGDLAKVRQLVQKGGGDLDKVNKERRSALHIASGLGYDVIVGELLDRQANTMLADMEGWTALHLAAAGGHARSVALLLGPRNRGSGAQDRRALMGARDKHGRCALLVAASLGQQGVVEELVKAGADIHSVDVDGSSAVHLAAQAGHLALLPALHAMGFNMDARNYKNGSSPLALAAAADQAHVAVALVRSGANTAAKDNDGLTPLDIAHKAGNTATYRALKEAMAATGAVASSATATPGQLLQPQQQGPRASLGGLGATASSPSVTGRAVAAGEPAGAAVAGASPAAAGQQVPAVAAPAGVSQQRITVPAAPQAPEAYPELPPGAAAYY